MKDSTKLRPFNEARAFVQKLRIKTRTDWLKYSIGELHHLPPKPDDIPLAPSKVFAYRDQWISWADWLGRPTKRKASTVSPLTVWTAEFARTTGKRPIVKITGSSPALYRIRTGPGEPVTKWTDVELARAARRLSRLPSFRKR